MKNQKPMILSFLSLIFIFWQAGNIFAQTLSYRTAMEEAGKKQNVSDSISYLTSVLPKMASKSDKRAVYYFIGSLQEQSGLFEEACKSYAQAASISAAEADSFKRSPEELTLDAVRCALSSGDFKTADEYLSSSVKNSSDEEILAYIKLYSVWSKLCRISDRSGLNEPVAALKNYASAQDMTSVRPQVLFTLWYLTGEKAWADSLKKNYPASLEAGTINGSVKLLPAPFWYFVPHNETLASSAEGDNANDKISSAGDKQEANNINPVKMQLGLFRERKNAESLVQKVSERGFKPYITTETRASGTTYFIVLVNDPDGTVAARLRSAGFECYRYD